MIKKEGRIFNVINSGYVEEMVIEDEQSGIYNIAKTDFEILFDMFQNDTPEIYEK